MCCENSKHGSEWEGEDGNIFSRPYPVGVGVVTTLNPAYSGNLVFARHETFHPQFGWLKKGFDAATQDPEVLVHEFYSPLLI